MPGQAKRTPEAEAAAAELIRQLENQPLAVEVRPSCPDREACFPNGIDPAWSGVTCVHGSFELGQQ